jgi:hypothetical protein
VRYNVTDSSQNAAIQLTRTVNVVTGNIPSLSLIDSPSISLLKNQIYTDAGATASDTEDGNITSDIITNNPVDTTTIGVYTVSYDVVDSNSNSAAQITRTIEILP